MGMLVVTQYIGQNILRKLRERDFGAIIDQKTGERRKMTPLEERYAMFLLGGRKGNTLRNHIRALDSSNCRGRRQQVSQDSDSSIDACWHW